MNDLYYLFNYTINMYRKLLTFIEIIENSLLFVSRSLFLNFSCFFTFTFVVNIAYSVCCIRFTVYSIQFTVNRIQYTIYSLQCTIHNIHYTVYYTQYTVYNKEYTIYNMQNYIQYTVLYTIYSIAYSAIHTVWYGLEWTLQIVVYYFSRSSFVG